MQPLPLHPEGAFPRRGFLVACWLPLLTACGGGSGVTDASPPPPPPGGITITTVGSLPGDDQSQGFAVNGAGNVVGQSVNTQAQTTRAYFYDGSLHNLTTAAGMTGVAKAISSGTPVYVVGYQQLGSGPRQAVIWTPASSSQPTVLETTESLAEGINDAGTAVGRRFDANLSAHPAIWKNGGRVDIPLLAGLSNGSASDINNDGIVCGIGYGEASVQDRSYVMLANGTIVELPSAPGGSGTQAYALSNVVNGHFYVIGAGYTTTDRRGLRWTVDAATGASTVEVLDQMTAATGVTDAGAVSGILTSPPNPSHGVLWRNGVYLTIPVTVDAGARGIAVSPTGSLYIVGDYVNGLPVAARWTVP